MKTRHPFTLLELFVVIIILVILFLMAVPLPCGSGKDNARQLQSQANLKKIGSALASYSTNITPGYYPTEVGADQNGTLNQMTWEASIKTSNRSTAKTMDVLFNSDADLIPPVDALLSPINGALRAPDLKNNGEYERLTYDNVGYHYVNGTVSTTVIDDKAGLMRDLNEGHDEGKVGFVLYGGGQVKKIEREGGKSVEGFNYRTNWYNNDKLFPNYQDFDNYRNKIDPRHPDEVD